MPSCAPTQAALDYQAAMLAAFPQLVPWGICSCRDIAGTSQWSDHAFGNAVDLHPPNKAYGDQAYAYALAGKAGPVRYVCWYGQGGCTTDHLDHIHASVNGECSGTPPCAGGSGSCAGTTTTSTGSSSGGGSSSDPLSAITSVLGFVADPTNWERVGLAIAGGASVGLGLLALARGLRP